MRSLIPAFIASSVLVTGAPALAAADSGAFAAAAPLELAHDTRHDAHDHDHDHDHGPAAEPLTREELRERKRELRRQERGLREQEQEARVRKARKAQRPRAWIGLGAGVGYGSVDVACEPDFFRADCTAEGVISTYSANITLSGPNTALRLRGIRDADKGGDARTPYETAAMLGSRFGYSNWYGFLGYGRVSHADDRYTRGDAEGLAWEIVFAPSSIGASGFELSFQGNNGHDVDYVAFNLGMRLGALR